jgi:hypothetical protein
MNRSLVHALSLLPLTVAAAALLLAPAGCNSIGCFPASEAGGTCPSQEEAIQYFDDPECGGRVASVDSEASIMAGSEDEGNLCCYSITNKDPEFTNCPDFD